MTVQPRPSPMESPDAWNLRNWCPQIGATLTFRGRILPTDFTTKRLRAVLREVGKKCSVSIDSLLWFLVPEIGKAGEREHLHLLLAGIPPHHVNETTCKFIVAKWRRKGGGFADVHLYDPARGEVGYVTKSSDALTERTGGPWYSDALRALIMAAR